MFTSKAFIRRLETVTYGIRDGRSISYDEFLTLSFVYPSRSEQTAIAQYLDKLSNLITLHQREHATGDNVRSAQRRQGPHNQINILVFQFMNNVKIRFLCGRHTGMAKSPGYASN